LIAFPRHVSQWERDARSLHLIGKQRLF
jgi:hypothetical protein